MEKRVKYALIGVVVLTVLYYFYRRSERSSATMTAEETRAAQTWPPQRAVETSNISSAPVGASAMPTTVAKATSAATPAATSIAAAATATTPRPGLVGVGAESPTYIAPVSNATSGICDSAFDEVAATLISANRVVDERIAPVISSKNGGLLPNLDVRGDYAAMMCVDEERADDCGCWNRSSAQRGIKLGYIKDTDRRRVVLAGP
jgi:hypothetical protein